MAGLAGDFRASPAPVWQRLHAAFMPQSEGATTIKVLARDDFGEALNLSRSSESPDIRASAVRASTVALSAVYAAIAASASSPAVGSKPARPSDVVRSIVYKAVAMEKCAVAVPGKSAGLLDGGEMLPRGATCAPATAIDEDSGTGVGIRAQRARETPRMWKSSTGIPSKRFHQTASFVKSRTSRLHTASEFTAKRTRGGIAKARKMPTTMSECARSGFSRARGAHAWVVPEHVSESARWGLAKVRRGELGEVRERMLLKMHQRFGSTKEHALTALTVPAHVAGKVQKGFGLMKEQAESSCAMPGAVSETAQKGMALALERATTARGAAFATKAVVSTQLSQATQKGIGLVKRTFLRAQAGSGGA
eukprot:CAMPEP_0117492154 /NCGR_PEP_ID=MMETSP0784-20121206/18435_1 /TAXON_ID=39447 /ORGANISM="" /LENGTH=364 /DNA_ID=CAMNT_0005286965 /DNA_START=25 /DNA_END=1119 /DNA_ORIENTATION=-